MNGGEIQELREFLEGKFGQIDGRLDAIDERVRENGVLIEENGDRIQIVSEYVLTVNTGVEQLRRDMKAGFEEQRRLLQYAYDGLDARVSDLERSGE